MRRTMHACVPGSFGKADGSPLRAIHDCVVHMRTSVMTGKVHMYDFIFAAVVAL